MNEPSTYGQLHAGDVVLGADGKTWGVLSICHGAGSTARLVLVQGTREVTGWPRRDEPVTVVHRCDTAAEAAAWAALAAAGLAPEVIAEQWER